MPRKIDLEDYEKLNAERAERAAHEERLRQEAAAEQERKRIEAVAAIRARQERPMTGSSAPTNTPMNIKTSGYTKKEWDQIDIVRQRLGDYSEKGRERAIQVWSTMRQSPFYNATTATIDSPDAVPEAPLIETRYRSAYPAGYRKSADDRPAFFKTCKVCGRKIPPPDRRFDEYEGVLGPLRDRLEKFNAATLEYMTRGGKFISAEAVLVYGFENAARLPYSAMCSTCEIAILQVM